MILVRTDFALRPVCGGLSLAMVPASQTFTPGELARANWSQPPRRIVRDGPVRKVEIANFRRAEVQGNALEILRTGWFAPNEARLQRVVTTLVAQPLNAQGEPDGEPIDVSSLTDPFQNPIPHPSSRRRLFVRWYLILDTDRLAQAEPLATIDESAIPRGVGIVDFMDNWADFRYAWQSRYSDEQVCDLSPDGFLRLFVSMSAPQEAGEGPAWRVRVGGLLTLAMQKQA